MRKKQLDVKQRGISIFLMLIVGVIFSFFQISSGQEISPEEVKTPLNQAILTHQQSQKERDAWETERLKLKEQYGRLLAEYENLQKKKEGMITETTALTTENKAFGLKIKEMKRMSQEIMPFLKEVTNRLESFVLNDTPFLSKERNARLKRVQSLLDEPSVSYAEKFRKVSEVLFIEVEYGNEPKVYSEKVRLNGEERLGNVFRLGRIALFFTTLDQTTAAFYSTSRDQWILLDKSWAGVIQRAIEMGMKKRPVELLNLPIGRMQIK